MAAATARQKSASKPVHSPLSLGAAKPARPVCTPHLSEPRAFTSSSVAADAAPQAKVTAAALKIPSIHLFIPKPSSVSRARPGFRSRVEAAAAFRFDPEHAQALVRWLPSHSRRPSKAIILPRSSQNGAQRALRARRQGCRGVSRQGASASAVDQEVDGVQRNIPLHIRRPQPLPRRPIIDCGADMSDDESRDWGINTRLAHSGHDPRAFWGFVNPPVVHASTVLYPDYDSHANRNQRYLYGTHGTPTTDALCEALNRLEGAAGTVLAPSGLAAITVPLLGFVSAGDHLLIVDSVYFPTRRFADTMLAR